VRALTLTGFGGPGDLTVGDLDQPEVGPGEVLVRMEFAALNHFDLLMVTGQLAQRPPIPHVPGIEGAGTIVSAGVGVPEDRLGERVSLYPYVGCRQCDFCLMGAFQICRVGQVNTLGFLLPGTMSQLVRAPADNALKVPDGLSLHDAAAVSLAGMTALRLISSARTPLMGKTVLVRAVASGVGSLVVQLAKAGGATIVIGTAGSGEKLDRATALGMDVGIDHATESVPARVKEAPAGAGADLVFDYVGAATWDDDVRSLARGGSLVLCGAHTGSNVGLDLWHVFAKELSIIGSYGGSRGDLQRTLRLAASGLLRPVVDAVMPLDEAAGGFERMQSRDHFGKILFELGG
jgi:2-desacetyl-2-hydroxyethyl bacteriochlorophyllide A dehydrogenase